MAQKPPVAKKKPVARPKVQPRQSTAHLTTIELSAPRKPAPDTAPQKTATAPKAVAAVKSAPAKSASAKPGKESADEKLKLTLDVFAKDCITRMNKQRRPGITHKEVKKQPDGSYLARYLAVDPDSLETSYNPTASNKTIKFIGRMDYHEVEYISTGKSQKQALAGPFSETNRVPITELIKYKNNKWTY